MYLWIYIFFIHFRTQRGVGRVCMKKNFIKQTTKKVKKKHRLANLKVSVFCSQTMNYLYFKKFCFIWNRKKKTAVKKKTIFFIYFQNIFQKPILVAAKWKEILFKLVLFAQKYWFRMASKNYVSLWKCCCGWMSVDSLYFLSQFCFS